MKKSAVAAIALTIFSTGAIAAPALAESNAEDKSAPPGATSAPMSVTGYDEAAAEANGFTIVTHEDGSWESIAVTEDAKKQNASTGVMRPTTADSGDGTAARRTVYGNCGSSWVDAYDQGRYVPASTGYNVTAPVYNRISWAIFFTSWQYGASSNAWPGGQTTPANWTGYSGALYPGPSDGFVVASGSVVLINGSVCSSGYPTDPL